MFPAGHSPFLRPKDVGMGIGIKEPPVGLSAEGKILFLSACEIAAIRTNRLTPVNTQMYNEAVRASVQIAEDVLNACRKMRPRLYE